MDQPINDRAAELAEAQQAWIEAKADDLKDGLDATVFDTVDNFEDFVADDPAWIRLVTNAALATWSGSPEWIDTAQDEMRDLVDTWATKKAEQIMENGGDD